MDAFDEGHRVEKVLRIEKNEWSEEVVVVKLRGFNVEERIPLHRMQEIYPKVKLYKLNRMTFGM